MRLCLAQLGLRMRWMGHGAGFPSRISLVNSSELGIHVVKIKL